MTNNGPANLKMNPPSFFLQLIGEGVQSVDIYGIC